MKGKTYVVTGANSGLGEASALALAQMGANVVMLCRNRQRGEAALADIRQRSGNPNVELILADLTSQASIRQFVESFDSRHDKLHGLLNCAGIATLHRQVTPDGLEVKFATEYLGHFLLTNLLVNALKAGAPSRVVTVSGEGHKAGIEGREAGRIDFDNLQGEKSWNVVKHGKQVVLAKILFTYELARRLRGTGVSANTLCPGLTRTNLVRHMPWYVRLYAAVRFAFSHPQTPEEGASHIVWLATAPELEGVTGKYFVRRREAKSSPESYDQAVARKLWEVSEALVGQRFDYGHLQE
ncbi:MAG: SDR family oxidoreductase [Anaerolineae bacterium]|nr:SDR family oxidoreductase [Anaerolineae bacterium]